MLELSLRGEKSPETKFGYLNHKAHHHTTAFKFLQCNAVLTDSLSQRDMAMITYILAASMAIYCLILVLSPISVHSGLGHDSVTV